jgi:hypothetical protein
MQIRKNEYKPRYHTFHRNQLKRECVKHLDNIGENPNDLGFGDNILGQSHRQERKKKLTNWTRVKLKAFVL